VCYEPPTVVASGRVSPQQVAVGSTHLYWREWGSTYGAVMQVPVAGGASQNPVTIATDVGSPGSLAADTADDVYYTVLGGCDMATGQSGSGAVYGKSASGQVIFSSYNQLAPSGIAVDASGGVYWLNSGHFKCYWADGGYEWYFNGWSLDHTGALMRSTSSSPLVSNLDPNRYDYTPHPMAANSNYVYWTDETLQLWSYSSAFLRSSVDSPVGAVTADSTNAYWINAGAVLQRANSGGPVLTLASGQAANGIAVDSSYVYWTSTGTMGTDGAIMKAPIMRTPNGGETVIKVQSAPNPNGYLAVDATQVYWTAGDTVWKASK
jgi:hypothetical protein